MFNSMNINGSALTAHKTFLDTVSNNIANMNTAAEKGKDTYKRQGVVFKDSLDGKLGVSVKQIVESDREDRLVYDPENINADNEGYVHYADIELSEEVADMLVAQRGYQLNLTSLNAIKEVYEKALTIGQ